jgi:hypothetical protein
MLIYYISYIVYTQVPCVDFIVVIFVFVITIITIIIIINYTLLGQHVNEVRIDLLLLFMYYLFIHLFIIF